MANATKLFTYGIYTLTDSSGLPITTVGNVSSKSTTSFELSSAIKDSAGANITGDLILGIRTISGATERIYVPAAGIASGVTITGATRGLKPSGTDVSSGLPTGSATYALDNIPEGSIVEMVMAAQQYNMIIQAIQGAIATNALNFYMGNGTDATVTIGYLDNVGLKGIIRKNVTTDKVEYSNDGTAWASVDAAAPANVTVRNVAGASANQGEIYTESTTDSLSYKDIDDDIKVIFDYGTKKIPVASMQTYYAADGEANDTYVITYDPAPAALVTGQSYYFKANTANTGACTVNINALGAKAIKKSHDQDTEDGDIESGSMIHLIYDGTNMQLQTPVATSLTTAQKTTLVGGGFADTLHSHDITQIGLSTDKSMYTILCDMDSFTATNCATGAYTGCLNIESSSSNWKLISTPTVYSIDTKLVIEFFGKIANGTTGDRHLILFATSNVEPFDAYNAASGGGACSAVSFVSNGATLYSKTALDTNATLTDISAGVTITDWHAYKIEVNFGTNAKFYIDGVLKSTHTTNLPLGGATYIQLGSGGNTSGEDTIITYPKISIAL